MKAFFLVAVVLLVLLAAFSIANAVFSDQNSQGPLDTASIRDTLQNGAGEVGSKMDAANASADSFAIGADNAAGAAIPTDSFSSLNN